jgi:single-strand DNA-binding protein
MLNQVILIGRLTREPELRYTPGNGVPVATFTLACERPFTNSEGEREADFIKVVTWRKLAENCAQYLVKGSLAAVTGRLQIRSYDSEGDRKWISEVVADNVRFLDNRRQQEDEAVGSVEHMLNSGTEINPDDVPF